MLRSSYVQENISHYLLPNVWMIVVLMEYNKCRGLQTYAIYGTKVYLFMHHSRIYVIVFGTPLKWLWRSYSFSNDTTHFGIRFVSCNLALSSRDLSCFSSSMAASLNIYDLVRNSKIYWSPLKTISLETPSLRGVNRVTALPKVLVVALLILGTNIILKYLNEEMRCHT